MLEYFYKFGTKIKWLGVAKSHNFYLGSSVWESSDVSVYKSIPLAGKFPAEGASLHNYSCKKLKSKNYNVTNNRAKQIKYINNIEWINK